MRVCNVHVLQQVSSPSHTKTENFSEKNNVNCTLKMKCQEGILFNHHKEPQELKTEASFEGECQDLFWAGSFCPPRQGRYRLIYEGNIDESWESETSFYQFNFSLKT